MPKTWSVAVFFSAACLLMLSACFPNGKKFAIVSPEQGQLIRDASSFEIEVMISAEDFDLSTLQAELNGSPLALDNKGDTFAAALASVQGLQPSNQLVVSASRLSDGAPSALAVEFSWEPLPVGLAFLDEFVTNPPPVETAELEILDTLGKRQNALLHVIFRDGFNAPTDIPYRSDAQTVFVLSDGGLGDDQFAGDGRYTARVDFDFENYRLRKSRELFATALDHALQEQVGRQLVLLGEINDVTFPQQVFLSGREGSLPRTRPPAPRSTLPLLHSGPGRNRVTFALLQMLT